MLVLLFGKKHNKQGHRIILIMSLARTTFLSNKGQEGNFL